ncbi:MAG TPA: hypothetical protein VF158_00985 [Longimicrobiales bacterium]
MSPVQLRPMGIGEILDGTFSLYRKHFALFFLTALIPFAPLIPLYATVLDPAALADPDAAQAATGTMVLLGLVSSIGTVVAMGALTHNASQAFTGGPVSFGSGFARGLRALFPLIGATIVIYIAVGAVGAVFAIAAPLVAAAAGDLPGAARVLLAIAAVVLIILLFIGLLTSIFAVVPAVVVERKGPIGALARSWQLARGARTRILVIFVVCWLITSLPLLGVMVALGLGTAMLDPDAAATMTTGQLYLEQSATILTGALTFPFFIACLVLTYYDRRIRAEGYDVQLATAAIGAAR